MWNLVIVPNNSGNFGVGHFNTLENAKSAQSNVHERLRLASSKEPVSVVIEDDYGSVISIPAAHISYTALIDVQKKSEAQVDTKLSEARAAKGFNERLMTNKELQVLFRFMQASQPQPQVIQVGGPQESPPLSQPN